MDLDPHPKIRPSELEPRWPFTINTSINIKVYHRLNYDYGLTNILRFNHQNLSHNNLTIQLTLLSIKVQHSLNYDYGSWPTFYESAITTCELQRFLALKFTTGLNFLYLNQPNIRTWAKITLPFTMKIYN